MISILGLNLVILTTLTKCSLAPRVLGLKIQLNMVQHGIGQEQLTVKEISEIESFFTSKFSKIWQKSRAKKNHVPALAHYCR